MGVLKVDAIVAAMLFGGDKLTLIRTSNGRVHTQEHQLQNSKS